MGKIEQFINPSPLKTYQESDLLPYLQTFSTQLHDVLYSIISTADGFPVAYLGIDEFQAARQAAMAASLDGLCLTLTAESHVNTPPPERTSQVGAVTIESDHCFLFSRQLQMLNGDNLVLLTACGKHENLATQQWCINQLIERLQAHTVS